MALTHQFPYPSVTTSDDYTSLTSNSVGGPIAVINGATSPTGANNIISTALSVSGSTSSLCTDRNSSRIDSGLTMDGPRAPGSGGGGGGSTSAKMMSIESLLKFVKTPTDFENFFQSLGTMGEQLQLALVLFTEVVELHRDSKKKRSSSSRSIVQKTAACLSNSLSPTEKSGSYLNSSSVLPGAIIPEHSGSELHLDFRSRSAPPMARNSVDNVTPTVDGDPPQGHFSGSPHHPLSTTTSQHHIRRESDLSGTTSLVSMQLPRSNRIRQALPMDAHGYEVLNDYTILDEIGSGASGTVMLALHSKTQDPFAIKAVSKSRKLKFGRALPTFDIEKEVAVMKKLKHPNIVRLHEVIDDPEEHMMYLVMDYVSNGPLFETTTDPVTNSITCTPFDDEDVLISLVKQLVAGLRYLHKRNIVHRDIKPDNLLRGDGNKVYIADFGVSEMVNTTEVNAPRIHRPSVGAVNGTPAFFAPEQCRGEALTPASDVWSFGVVLYLAKFGRLPFPGKGSIPSLIKDILEKDLTFPDDADPAWKDCLSKLLQKDAYERMTLKEFLAHPLLFDSYLGNNSSLAESAEFTPSRSDYFSLHGDDDDDVNHECEITMRNHDRVLFYDHKTAVALEEKANDLLHNVISPTNKTVVTSASASLRFRSDVVSIQQQSARMRLRQERNSIISLVGGSFFSPTAMCGVRLNPNAAVSMPCRETNPISASSELVPTGSYTNMVNRFFSPETSISTDVDAPPAPLSDTSPPPPLPARIKRKTMQRQDTCIPTSQLLVAPNSSARSASKNGIDGAHSFADLETNTQVPPDVCDEEQRLD